MSGMHPMGGRWLRTDRSAVNAKLNRKTLGRIGRFAVPHRATIATFLLITVLDAAIVVANPLLIKRLVDDGSARTTDAWSPCSRSPWSWSRSSTPASGCSWAGCPRGSGRG
jgi:hypothetical protein